MIYGIFLHFWGMPGSRSAKVLMNLCLCRCFRWRHGWFIPVWACSTKPTPWCIPLGLHLFRYCRLDFFSLCTWSSLIRGGIFVLERVNWRLITTIKRDVKTLHQCFHASIPTVNCPHAWLFDLTGNVDLMGNFWDKSRAPCGFPLLIPF